MREPEFSLIVAMGDVPPAGKELHFEADQTTRTRLARRYGIPEITRLAGTARIRPYRKEGLTLDCHFEAELVQNCVVTLDPVTQHIDEEFRQRYLPEPMTGPEPDAPENDREITIDVDAEDSPEPMKAGKIDIGETVAEQLARAIDPYPRKPGVSFDPPSPSKEAGDASESRPNPFAVLEKLKQNS